VLEAKPAGCVAYPNDDDADDDDDSLTDLR